VLSIRRSGLTRRAVPLHWTFQLGGVSLSCLAVLAVTGIVLTFYVFRMHHLVDASP
jgi:hypothetical protein